MKKFKYRAMKPDGGKVEQEYEANSRDEVVAMITANGYYPLKIEEVSNKTSINFSFSDKVGSKDLAVFCRQMYTMLDAGVSITNALNMMTAQTTNKKLQGILQEVEEDVKKGAMLSEAMDKHKNIFPQLLISMIQSGEVTGNIDEMMYRMSVHFEKKTKTNNKVKSAMIYPIVLGIVAVVAVAFILTFVMPTFTEMFESSGTEIPAMTKGLIGISNFFKSNIIFIILGIIAIIIGLKAYGKTDGGKRNFSILKLKLPILADLNKKIITARFTRTMSTLLSAGISLVQALPIVAAVMGNTIATEEISKVRERVVRGEGLSEPMSGSDIFPEMLSSMIKIGEESCSLDDILNKTADFYDEEVDQAIQAATALLEPAIIILMGLAIGFIVMAIMIPMFDMYGTIS